MIVSALELYVPVTLLASLPFKRQVTLPRSLSVEVPVTLTTIWLTSKDSPSLDPPSDRVKSKISTASPTVSMVVSIPTGSVTVAEAVRSPSLSWVEDAVKVMFLRWISLTSKSPR